MKQVLVLFATIAVLSACTSARTIETIDFGDDDGLWPFDNECDDPRFAGPGVYDGASAIGVGHDATDCRELYELGAAYWVGTAGTNGIEY